MTRKALVRTSDGRVVNVILLEKGAKWSPPAGHEVLDALDAGPGDTWDGAKYVKPAPKPSNPDPLQPWKDEFALADTVTKKAAVMARFLKLA